MYWNLSSPRIFLYRRPLTAPLNCSTCGTCSSLYHLLKAASRSLVMVARTTKMVTAMCFLLDLAPRAMTFAGEHSATVQYGHRVSQERFPRTRYDPLLA